MVFFLNLLNARSKIVAEVEFRSHSSKICISSVLGCFCSCGRLETRFRPRVVDICIVPRIIIVVHFPGSAAERLRPEETYEEMTSFRGDERTKVKVTRKRRRLNEPVTGLRRFGARHGGKRCHDGRPSGVLLSLKFVCVLDIGWNASA